MQWSWLQEQQSETSTNIGLFVFTSVSRAGVPATRSFAWHSPEQLEGVMDVFTEKEPPPPPCSWHGTAAPAVGLRALHGGAPSPRACW